LFIHLSVRQNINGEKKDAHLLINFRTKSLYRSNLRFTFFKNSSFNM